MKSVTVGVILAVLLFVVAVACRSEARLALRLADAHTRLATLHYDVDDDIDSVMNAWHQLPWPDGSSVATNVQHHRATVEYWRGQFDSLTAMTNALGQKATTDPELLFLAANASFRSSAPHTGDRKAAVERLDVVMQAYADVLRRDPSQSDAAYNYEFVSKMRDTLVKAPAARPGAKERSTREKPVNVSVDLPSGGTIHGLPGGPPEGTDMSDFKTITPMRYDEREEQTLPGRGKELKRRG